jgi:hypothetical protein
MIEFRPFVILGYLLALCFHISCISNLEILEIYKFIIFFLGGAAWVCVLIFIKVIVNLGLDIDDIDN